MTTPRSIRMHANDNVAIVVNDGGLPVGAVMPDGLTLVDRVPQGHKVRKARRVLKATRALRVRLARKATLASAFRLAGPPGWSWRKSTGSTSTPNG